LVSASADGSLHVKLHPEAVKQFGSATVETKELWAIGTAQYDKMGGPIASPELVEFQFNHKDQPSEFGIALVENENLEGWFITFNRNSRTIILTREPRPLDDFWADLTARADSHREVDGAILASVAFDSSQSIQSGQILIDGEVVEVYINGNAAIAHRIEGGVSYAPVAFCVDGVSSLSVKRSKISPT
jgi:hypothetical protein